MPDFKKLGVDRMAVNIAKTVGAGTGNNLITGDITKGEVVEVGWSTANTTASVNVGPRRTGAILLGVTFSGAQDLRWYSWSISDSELTAETDAAKDSAAFTFWVF